MKNIVYAIGYDDFDNDGCLYRTWSSSVFETPDDLKNFLRPDLERTRLWLEERSSDIEQYLKNPEHLYAFMGVALTYSATAFSPMPSTHLSSTEGFDSKQKFITVNRIQNDNILKKELNSLRIQLDSINRIFLANNWDEINEPILNMGCSLIPVRS